MSHPKRKAIFKPSFFRGELLNFGGVSHIPKLSCIGRFLKNRCGETHTPPVQPNGENNLKMFPTKEPRRNIDPKQQPFWGSMCASKWGFYKIHSESHNKESLRSSSKGTLQSRNWVENPQDIHETPHTSSWHHNPTLRLPKLFLPEILLMEEILHHLIMYETL